MNRKRASAAFEPIAIVGQACVLPGALDPNALWQAVRAGQDLLSSAPPGRWRLSVERAVGKGVDCASSDRGGYVQGFETIFEPDAYALDVRGLDPLFQWLLHVAREAMLDAGVKGGARVGGVFGNLSFPSASMSRFAERAWLGDELADAAGIPPVDPRNRFGSGLPAHLTAQALKLGAGAFCLDAACASSLYALKLACDRLHDRRADLMLAGAVNCADDLFIHIGFSALQAMSRSGRSRPFHKDADGLVPAEGAGAVVLERLADAEKKGRRVLGVIRGIGLSNDGRGSGMLSPSEGGQVRAMEDAYRQAGLEPKDVSLVECHATGTAVGDRVEIRSMRRVFAGARAAVPIGSLKSNFGHAITAAGVAGLIKVLGAIAAKERPPTLHADEPLEELLGSPLRLIEKVEPWPSKGPRRAAVSAFGFGGTNAHLIVEEHVGRSRPRARVVPPRVEVAIVGLGARIGGTADAADFEAALLSSTTTPSREGGTLHLDANATRFPPRDLSLALAQQVWLLAAAGEALEGIALPAPERVGVFVGMGCDAEVARYGARWRMGEHARKLGADDPAWTLRAADACTAPLEAAGVIGTLPNLPANRLNFQLDLGGPSFTVSAEELSGVRALEIAARAIRCGEIDAALVGAADFCREKVHHTAAKAVGIAGEPGDAALVLVLQRADEARRSGVPILALLDAEPDAKATLFKAKSVEDRFGRSHSAFGLVQVAAAALQCARRSRAVRVKVEALGGQQAAISVSPSLGPSSGRGARSGEGQRIAPQTSLGPPSLVSSISPSLGHQAQGDALTGAERRGGLGRGIAYPAHPPPVVLPPLPGAQDVLAEWIRLSPAAPAAAQPMPRPPSLQPILEEDLAVAPTPVTARADMPPPHVLAWLTEQQKLLARVHRDFVESQAAAERAFLETRARMAQRLLEIGTGSAPQPLPKLSPPPAPAIAIPKAPVRPGLKLDHRGLMTHASGRISDIYGPLFEKQDGFRRQVRMPEPPLLLADRLLGIDAEPGSMGKGRLWTETTVADGAWYLHEGRMPAGLMIEAGQADLMLISYLGVDFLNRGERIYRLLGCDLTYHRSLPVEGETLSYEIRVEGHAQQGAVRLFFFQYDCAVQGEPRLTVRNGQAGFFTDAELAGSAGVLWDPQTAERRENPRLDAPAVPCERTKFDRAQLEAFSEGRAHACFGKGFAHAATHTRTPRIAGGKMLLLDEVTAFAPRGGPWGRGYLRATDRIAPDDWFFQGHFKDDPCMPGTLMFEGCLQAMAVYLAAQGYTLDKDGWRFEPVPEETYRLRCRGQVTPASHELVYEVFVEEIEAGEHPTLWADLLCTVDGLKAFHCRRMGLRLVPGWPLDTWTLANRLVDERPVARVDGFDFGARSLVACAWGKPSEAFGGMYKVFDGARRVPRLPGPPYLFMSRIARVEGGIGAMKVGSAVEAEYDVPPEAWYFDSNGARTMPYCVLLEAALQPCGWLASYVGSALGTDQDLFFRNLDGNGRLVCEIPPEAATIKTRSVLTNISRSAGMIIESFDVTCTIGARTVYELATVFGFFPKEALEAQRGLPVPDDEREALSAPSSEAVDLSEQPQRYFGPGPRLPSSYLLVLPRLTGIWLDGGRQKLGRFRAEAPVDPSAWFFKAHFFQDPVQPGSLGLEAMLQTLQFAMIRVGLADDARAHFEPIALGEPLVWKYRGQVRPHNTKVTVLLDLVRVDREARLAVADASLWVDGLRIYEATGMAMRVVPDAAPAPEPEETLSLETHPWLLDHRPTWTVPALPMMSMVDRLSAAVARAAEGKRVVAVEWAQVHRWLPLSSAVRLTTRVEPAGDGAFDATLLAWREAPRAELSRFEPVATARVSVADDFDPAASPLPPLSDARPVELPYARGALFHGPAFQLLRSLARGKAGASAVLDAGAPREIVLDALTHAIPHDSLCEWEPGIPASVVAYPTRVDSMRLFGEVPSSGEVVCETRYLGLDGSGRPRFRIQAAALGRVLLQLELTESVFPKGPLGSAEPSPRRAFLRDRQYVPGLRLSQESQGATRLLADAMQASDWLPGTLSHAYAASGAGLDEQIAAKEHVAERAQVHPASVKVDRETGLARCDEEPLSVWPLSIRREGDGVLVRDAGPARLDLALVREYWDRTFSVGRWPVEDLYYGLAERFVRRVRLESPRALCELRGRGVLYLANHQVAVESLMFSVILSGLTSIPTITLAKAEHRTSWLGLLIKSSFSYPGVKDPGVITFFDRAAQGELPRVVVELAEELRTGKKSVMVHVEGTRALSCRAPVVRMSGAFIDMAIATGTPVVPVRFLGGLPVEPVPARLEFPAGMGQQDVWVGKPIAPSTLARLNYKERKDLVVAAINALGPKDDGPFVSDSDFAAAAEARARRSHCSPEHAVLFETLKRVAAPCEETRRFLDAVLSGQALSGAEKDRWLARWFMSGAFAGSPGLD